MNEHLPSDHEGLGRRLRVLGGLAAPAAVNMLSYSLVGVVDTLMVGWLGATELAAVGLSNTILFTGGALMMGLIGATNPLTAQRRGAGRLPEAGALLHQATWLAVFGGLVWGGFLVATARPILATLQSDPAITALGTDYLQARALGLVLMFLTIARDNFLQGMGDTRSPMRVSLMLNLVNGLANYVLIFGVGAVPGLGVAGAAWATVAAHGVSLVLYRWVLRGWQEREPTLGLGSWVAPNLPVLRELWRVGLPMGAHFALDIGSWATLTVFVAWMGTHAQAANQVVIRLLNITFMILAGISIASTSRIGLEIGAGRLERARAYGWTALVLGLLVTLPLSMVAGLFRGPLVALFTADPKVLELAGVLMLYGLAFQLFDALAMVGYGVLKGASDTRAPAVVAALAAWGVGVPVGYLCAFRLELGVTGVYLGILAQMLLTSSYNLWRISSGVWLRAAAEPPAAVPEDPDGVTEATSPPALAS